MRSTEQTLLDRLRDPLDERAWEDFYQGYASAILRYAGKLGLDEDSAQDVLQETMMVLIRKLPGFAYDPRRGRFRNYLLTVVHRKTLAALRRRGRRQEVSVEGGEGTAGGSLADVLADPSAEMPFEVMEANWRESLYAEALGRVQGDPALDSRTFEVFRAYAVEQQPAGDVAAHFGLKENAVYQIKNRLIRRLRREVEALARGLE